MGHVSFIDTGRLCAAASFSRCISRFAIQFLILLPIFALLIGGMRATGNRTAMNQKIHMKTMA
jgi:hypothetical protein